MLSLESDYSLPQVFSVERNLTILAWNSQEISQWSKFPVVKIIERRRNELLWRTDQDVFESHHSTALLEWSTHPRHAIAQGIFSPEPKEKCIRYPDCLTLKASMVKNMRSLRRCRDRWFHVPSNLAYISAIFSISPTRCHVFRSHWSGFFSRVCYVSIFLCLLICQTSADPVSTRISQS